ncbi:hypothetical protein ACF3M2_04760 [Tissierella carlieri]|jgi:hypothetical protein|nr:hypothetical protein [Tissierella sp. P1]
MEKSINILDIRDLVDYPKKEEVISAINRNLCCKNRPKLIFGRLDVRYS